MPNDIRQVSGITWPEDILDYTTFDGAAVVGVSGKRKDGAFPVNSEKLSRVVFVKPVESFAKLTELVSLLAILNPDHQLYFRGQVKHYTADGAASLLPTLFRVGGDDRRQAVSELFEREQALLKGMRKRYKYNAYTKRISRSPLGVWSLLQHYGASKTPLIDLTSSLQVACTFAQGYREDGVGYIYVLGMPYQTEAVMSNTQERLCNLSLLSVCPQDALRPIHQDGYLVTSANWWRICASPESGWALDGSSAPNLARRLLAAFQVPCGPAFWRGSSLDALEEGRIYPKDDPFGSFLEDCGLDLGIA